MICILFQTPELSLHKNPLQNVLWATETQSIFDSQNKGQLNPAVLLNLLRFYLNPPRPIPLENSTPYLGTPIQQWPASTEEEEKQRILTFYNFRDMVCQRIYRNFNLRKKRPPEIHEYEYIYKIYFNAMPMDKRLKFFEFPRGFPGSDPYNTPYSLQDPTYIKKGVKLLMKQVAERKEAEAVEQAKLAEALKYGVSQEPTRKKRK